MTISKQKFETILTTLTNRQTETVWQELIRYACDRGVSHGDYDALAAVFQAAKKNAVHSILYSAAVEAGLLGKTGVFASQKRDTPEKRFGVELTHSIRRKKDRTRTEADTALKLFASMFADLWTQVQKEKAAEKAAEKAERQKDAAYQTKRINDALKRFTKLLKDIKSLGFEIKELDDGTYTVEPCAAQEEEAA